MGEFTFIAAQEQPELQQPVNERVTAGQRVDEGVTVPRRVNQVPAHRVNEGVPVQQVAANFLAIVTKALDPKSDQDEVIVAIEDHKLKRKDLKCLRPTKWLTCDIINAYVGLLERRAKTIVKPKCFFLPTHFYLVLTSPAYNFNAALAYLKGIELWSYELIIIPIYRPKHWVLVVVDLTLRQLHLLDPLVSKEQAPEDMANVARFLHDFAMLRSRPYLLPMEWPFIVRDDIPAQPDNHNCGVYVIIYMERISKGSTLEVDPLFLGVMRQKIIVDLICQTITL